MDAPRFDHLARSLRAGFSGVSRRTFVAGLASGLLGTLRLTA
jgi:hypothetical protein